MTILKAAAGAGVRFPGSAARTGTLTLVIAAVAITGGTGCGAGAPGGPGWAGTVDTLPNGTIVVRNPAPGFWSEADAWRLESDLSIGRLEGDGPDVFGEVTALEVDDAGRIYVLDRQAREVRVFDADGAHVRSFGRRGRGPGELQDPIGLFRDPGGRLWIPDPANARYAIFETDGTFVDAPARPLAFHMMPWPGGMDRDGRVYDVAAVSGIAEGMRLGLVRFDETMSRADTVLLPHFATPQWMILNQAGMPSMSVVVPFAPTLAWRLDGRGHVWFAVTDRYRIHQQALGGDTLRIIEREASRRPVTAAERDSALAAMDWFVQQGGQTRPGEVPREKPVLHGLLVDDAGYLWVVPDGPAAEQGRRLDVFDPDGRYLGEVRADRAISFFSPVIIRGDALYAVVRDDMAVPVVTRWRIVGRESA